MSNEKLLWSGSPSQILNVPGFIGLGLLFWLVIPIFMIAWRWLLVRSIKYQLSTERLRTQIGPFDQEEDEIELYRVVDQRVTRPFFLKLFSLGNVVLITTDETHPTFTIQGIRNPQAVRNTIRTQAMACRRNMGIREIIT